MIKTATPNSRLVSARHSTSLEFAALLCFLIACTGSVRAQAPGEPAKATIESVRLAVSPLVPRTAEGERSLFIASIDSGGLSNVTVRLTSPAWPEARTKALGVLDSGKQTEQVSLLTIDTSGPCG